MANKVLTAPSLQVGSSSKPVVKSYISDLITTKIHSSDSTTSPYIAFYDGSWFLSNDGVKVVDIGSGQSPTAERLSTARKINGVLFDGTADITVQAVANGGTCEVCTGNAATTTKLKTPVSVIITGDASANISSWDGSQNLSIALTIPNASTTAKGTTTMASLTDVNDASSLTKAVTPYSLLKANANGVASLDNRAKVPVSQIPLTVSNLDPSAADGNEGDIWIVVSE